VRASGVSPRAASAKRTGTAGDVVALILPFRGITPVISPDAFLAPNAVVIGNVTIGAESSVWFGAVLRGDHPDHAIVVGRATSVQDNCVVHVGGWGDTVIGDDCTIGHGAAFESCTIGSGCVVGMNAVILQRAKIGEQCIIAAGSVVLEGMEVPARSLVAGVPAKIKGSIEGSSAKWIDGGGRHYVELSREYLAEGYGVDAGEAAKESK
jgi:carbonic anhydrase/acetyltransferase-like protein (isoleucine patch superfamily)